MRRVFGDKVEVTDFSLNPVCGSRLGFQPSCKATGRGDRINFVATESFMWYGAFGEGKTGGRARGEGRYVRCLRAGVLTRKGDNTLARMHAWA